MDPVCCGSDHGGAPFGADWLDGNLHYDDHLKVLLEDGDGSAGGGGGGGGNALDLVGTMLPQPAAGLLDVFMDCDQSCWGFMEQLSSEWPGMVLL